MQGLSLVAASGGHSSSQCAGLSLSRPLLLWSTGSRRAGSVVVAHEPSCSAACGIFPDQGSNLCPLHWQADSQPLRHQGSPMACLFTVRSNWVRWAGLSLSPIQLSPLTFPPLTWKLELPRLPRGPSFHSLTCCLNTLSAIGIPGQVRGLGDTEMNQTQARPLPKELTV